LRKRQITPGHCSSINALNWQTIAVPASDFSCLMQINEKLQVRAIYFVSNAGPTLLAKRWGDSHHALGRRVMHGACEELGLDPSQLPAPQIRV
jgi:hypothetical protein